MTDNRFYLVGWLISPEADNPGPIPPPDPELIVKSSGDWGEIFLVVCGQKSPDKIHQIIAIPEAASNGRACIQQKAPAFVSGTIRSFKRQPMLIATYIRPFTYDNTICQDQPFPNHVLEQLSKLRAESGSKPDPAA